MTFQEAERKFQELEQQWDAGQLTYDAYRAAQMNLRVVDAYGQVWMMQEHTGIWFVYRNGQWMRPAQAPTPPVATTASAALQPQPPATKSWRPSLALIIGVVCLCLVGFAVLSVGALAFTGTISVVGLFPPSSAQVEENADVPQAAVRAETATTAPADGAPHSDENGVTLVVPPDALAESDQVNLTANQLNTTWRQTVEENLSIDTPFYSLSAPGEFDSNGSLSLTFPTGDPNARVLAVIDGEYLVELAQTPSNGALTIQTRAAPTEPDVAAPDGDGSIYYAVVSPKNTAQQPGSVQMASYHPQPDERNCIPDISLIGGASINLCRQNPTGTIQVMLPTAHRDLLPEVDMMVDQIEEVMQKYSSLGFTAAKLDKKSPLLVRVSSKIANPSYYPLNGVLYIPIDTVSKMATQTPTDVYHEMAHWIQSFHYSIRLAYWSEERTWWLETSAENMVMLVYSDYVGENLLTYGTISASDGSLAMQASPYQWPGDYYVQAQLLKINLCDDPSCPLNTASFAKAINEGTYPFKDAGAKALVNANLREYAFYLLGKTPLAANSAIPLNGPVKTGDGYGEYVRITRTKDVDLKYDTNGAAPQVSKENLNGIDTLVIQAALQADGVYPLTIQGGSGANSGLPVELVIEPGPAFYYTVDDGEVQYSDGNQELKLRPIHGDMGVGKIRLVAMGESGGEVFKARVQPLDLSGAWIVAPSGPQTVENVICEQGDEEEGDFGSYGIFLVHLNTIESGSGNMELDSTGRNLDYVAVPSRVPAQIAEAKVTFQASSLLAGTGILYQSQVDWPDQSSSSRLPTVAPLAAALVLPAVWLGRKRLSPRVVQVTLNLLVIGFVALVSTGCFGLGLNFYGTANLNAEFQKIEYVGGEDTGVLTIDSQFSGVPAGSPVWRLTGTGTYDVVLNVKATTVDEEDNESSETRACSGTLTFPVTAYIYNDVLLSLSQE